jgi:hypothetical protein
MGDGKLFGGSLEQDKDRIDQAALGLWSSLRDLAFEGG